MNSLFVPKELKERDLLSVGKTKSLEDNILVFSCGKSVYASENFFSEPVALRDYQQPVECLGVHQNKVWAGRNYSNSHTDLANCVVGDIFDLNHTYDSEFGSCHALVSQEGELCVGVNYNEAGIQGSNGYFGELNTIDGKLLGGFTSHINDLAVHEGAVYEAAVNGKVWVGETDYSFGGITTTLCSFKGSLYVSVFNSSSSVIQNVFTGAPVIKRKGRIFSMFEWDGNMYDVSQNGKICNSFLNTEVFDWGFGISDCVTVPRVVLEGRLGLR